MPWREPGLWRSLNVKWGANIFILIVIFLTGADAQSARIRVVFSFFKKKGVESPAQARSVARRGPGKAPGAAASAADFEVDTHGTLASIQVSDAESGMTQAAEEAAIFYANGRADAAIDTLLRGVAESDDLRFNLQAWFMLFDLFQLQGMKKEFDELALDFVVAFERSAPVWDELAAEDTLAAEPKSLPVPYALTGTLCSQNGKQVVTMEKLAQLGSGLRLDLGRIRAVEDGGCTELHDALQRIVAGGADLVLAGSGNLEKLLRREIDARGTGCDRAVWLLLLQLYQLQGKQGEYEGLSVDYAVGYEVSPPTWEPPTRLALAQDRAGYGAKATEGAEAESLPLKGSVMLGSNPPQLNQIANYAAVRTLVNLDFSGIRRIDFVAAGALLNTLGSLTQGGKGIIIHGANEMIQALFNIVGVNQFAVIARDKQH